MTVRLERPPIELAKRLSLAKPRTARLTERATLMDSHHATRFEVADLGSGHQLTRLQANGVDWHFAESPMFILKTYDIVGGSLAADVPASAFTTVAVETTGGFTVTYSLTGVPIVVVTGTIVDSVLSLFWDWLLTAPGFSTWAFEWNLAIAPQNVAQKAGMCAQLPVYGGITYRDATAVQAGPPTADYPGFHAGGVPPQVTNGGTAGAQLCCAWDLASRSCLALRTTAMDGQGLRYQYTGDGSNVVFTVYEFPVDNCAASSASSSFALQLAPLKGDWYDAWNWYRERIEAEGAPFIGRGKIADMDWAEGDTNTISTFRLDADVMIYMGADTDYVPGVEANPSAWVRPVEEITRIREDFGTDLKYIVQWYSWHNNGGDNWPDCFPPFSGFLTAVASIAALSGMTQIVYVYPTLLDPDSAFLAANPAAAGYIALFPDQTARTVVGGIDSPHDLIEFGTPAARALLETWWDQVYTAISGIQGWYVDTLSGNGIGGDYRSTLAATDKGPGAAFYNAGKKTWIDDMRTHFKITRHVDQWMTVGEWQDEHMLPVIDSQGAIVDDYPSALNIFMPGYVTAYSQYVCRFDYSSSFRVFADINECVDYDIWLWRQERQWHQGTLLGLSKPAWIDRLFIIAEVGDNDARYATVFLPYERPFLDFMLTMIRTLTDCDVRKYHRGRRLRPMAGSVDDLLVRNGYAVSTGEVVTGGVTGPLVGDADVQSSVWLSEELDAVGILLTNHHEDERTFRVRMTPELYPDMVGHRFFVRNVAGTRTLIETLTGHLDRTITVAAGTADVYELLADAP